MIRGKYSERCLFAEEVINDKNNDTNHRKTTAVNKRNPLSQENSYIPQEIYIGRKKPQPTKQKKTTKKKTNKENMETQGNNYRNRHSVVNMPYAVYRLAISQIPLYHFFTKQPGFQHQIQIHIKINMQNCAEHNVLELRIKTQTMFIHMLDISIIRLCY